MQLTEHRNYRLTETSVYSVESDGPNHHSVAYFDEPSEALAYADWLKQFGYSTWMDAI